MFPTAKEAGAKAEGKAEELKRKARDAIESNDIADTAERVGSKVRKFYDNAVHEVSEVSDNVSRQIRNKPVQSSFLALGAGVILGLLLGRR